MIGLREPAAEGPCETDPVGSDVKIGKVAGEPENCPIDSDDTREDVAKSGARVAVRLAVKGRVCLLATAVTEGAVGNTDAD